MILVKTYVFSTFDKEEDFWRLKLFPERFFFTTGSSWPPDSNFTMRKCPSVQCSQILIKTYCWHLWPKSHFGVLCGAFCNIIFSFLLIWTTVFKSNPKRLSISFYIPFVTWKMHSKRSWPEITNMKIYLFQKVTKNYVSSPNLNIIFMSTIASSKIDFGKSKLTSNWKTIFSISYQISKRSTPTDLHHPNLHLAQFFSLEFCIR